jgi:hypothetical protein
MTAAERNRRKRRLERAGYKALPTGWVPAAYADKVAAQVAAYHDDVEAAAVRDLPARGKPHD